MKETFDGSTDEERDLLYAWVREEENKRAILFGEEVDPDEFRRELHEGTRLTSLRSNLSRSGSTRFLSRTPFDLRRIEWS